MKLRQNNGTIEQVLANTDVVAITIYERLLELFDGWFNVEPNSKTVSISVGGSPSIMKILVVGERIECYTWYNYSPTATVKLNNPAAIEDVRQIIQQHLDANRLTENNLPVVKNV